MALDRGKARAARAATPPVFDPENYDPELFSDIGMPTHKALGYEPLTEADLDLSAAEGIPASERDRKQPKSGKAQAAVRPNEMDAEAKEEPDSDPMADWLTLSDLRRLPPPKPLIEGWLDQGTTAVVTGATGTNKTFTVLGWALSVATGVKWLGHKVSKTGTVLFVLGEGAYGLASRIEAWEEEHGVRVPEDRLRVLKHPKGVAPVRRKDGVMEGPFWWGLDDAIEATDAVLVVLDTFSSLAPEADETKDAALVVSYMSKRAEEHGATLILVHHTGWVDKRNPGTEKRARGGSQFEANPDTVINLSVDSSGDEPNPPVAIWRKKNKEGPAGLTIHARRKEVGKSCVLVRDTPLEQLLDKAEMQAKECDLGDRILTVVRDHPGMYSKSGKTNSLLIGLKDRFGKAGKNKSIIEEVDRLIAARQVIRNSDGTLSAYPVDRGKKGR
ncbi:AAA family ATPase [Micromonospora aurantiaca (nom. illeg.)]|uniref:AAA family ATPase n=1 Tax=Micromonospora aurantiaca (nom. illeg.) TaxID=47850 RepID=UPI0033DF7218